MTYKKRVLKTALTTGAGFGATILLTVIAATPTWKTWLFWGIAYALINGIMALISWAEWNRYGRC